MLKKSLFILALLMALPCIAEETTGLLYSENINMTPQRTFSGYSSSTNKYPKLNSIHNSSVYRTYSTQDQQRTEIMKAKSVKDIGNYSRFNDKDSSMTYGQFPQNRDSSDMMHLQQINNGVQNMFMNF